VLNTRTGGSRQEEFRMLRNRLDVRKETRANATGDMLMEIIIPAVLQKSMINSDVTLSKNPSWTEVRTRQGKWNDRILIPILNMCCSHAGSDSFSLRMYQTKLTSKRKLIRVDNEI